MLIERGNKRFYKISIVFRSERIPTDVIIYNKERKLIACIRFLFVIYIFENFNFPPFIISKFHKTGYSVLDKIFRDT